MLQSSLTSLPGRICFNYPQGMVTGAKIHWAAGPVTNAHLGLAKNGALVLYEWTAAQPVELERKGKKPVKSLELLDWTYKRVR